MSGGARVGGAVDEQEQCADHLSSPPSLLASKPHSVVNESGTTQCRVHGEIAKIRGSGFDVQVGTVKNDKRE